MNPQANGWRETTLAFPQLENVALAVEMKMADPESGDLVEDQQLDATYVQRFPKTQCIYSRYTNSFPCYVSFHFRSLHPSILCQTTNYLYDLSGGRLAL
jgi:hypothetical protein